LIIPLWWKFSVSFHLPLWSVEYNIVICSHLTVQQCTIATFSYLTVTYNPLINFSPYHSWLPLSLVSGNNDSTLNFYDIKLFRFHIWVSMWYLSFCGSLFNHFIVPSMLSQMTVFHWVHVPHFIYPFLNLWMFRLFQFLFSWEYSSNEYWRTDVSPTYLNFSYLYLQ
jgi:hypothetical protein